MEGLFIGLVLLLVWFLFIYLPKRNTSVNREDLVPIAGPNAWQLCNEVHGSTWMKLGRLVQVDGMTRKFYCPICETHR